MKKFKFSLDVVLVYKQQVLEALRGEHAAAIAAVRAQEDLLEQTWQQYRDYDAEYTQRKESGITISDAMAYQIGLRALEIDIQQATEKLQQLKKTEEKKREQVVEAKKECSSLEKLREKKLDVYHKTLQKDEEQRIEEFVSAYGVGSSVS